MASRIPGHAQHQGVPPPQLNQIMPAPHMGPIQGYVVQPVAPQPIMGVMPPGQNPQQWGGMAVLAPGFRPGVPANYAPPPPGY